MKKEFVVSKIESMQDGSGCVRLVLNDVRGNFAPIRRQQGFPENTFGITTIPITSLDDLKNLPKNLADAINGALSGDGNNTSSKSTTFRMNEKELKDLDIRLGDKLTFEFKLAKNDIVE